MKTIHLARVSRSLSDPARELNSVDRESLALSGHPEFLELIAQSRAEFSAGRTLSLEEMRAAVLPPRPEHKRPARKTRRRAR